MIGTRFILMRISCLTLSIDVELENEKVSIHELGSNSKKKKKEAHKIAPQLWYPNQRESMRVTFSHLELDSNDLSAFLLLLPRLVGVFYQVIV